jgi:hypothetical protein
MSDRVSIVDGGLGVGVAPRAERFGFPSGPGRRSKWEERREEASWIPPTDVKRFDTAHVVKRGAESNGELRRRRA